jgi:hypothetical protein
MAQQTQRFGLKIRTRLSYEELDNVLGQHSRAGYSISIGGIDDAGTVRRKIMILSFEQSEDRDRLKIFFAARRSAAGLRGQGPGASAAPDAASLLDEADGPVAAA